MIHEAFVHFFLSLPIPFSLLIERGRLHISVGTVHDTQLSSVTDTDRKVLKRSTAGVFEAFLHILIHICIYKTSTRLLQDIYAWKKVAIDVQNGHRWLNLYLTVVMASASVSRSLRATPHMSRQQNGRTS